MADLIRHLEDHAWVSVTVVSDTGSEVLQATAEHPFFVTTAPTAFYPGQVAMAGGWVNAADLTVGDVVRTADGGSAVVAGVTVTPVTTNTLDWAFNLTVANDHTYYVGKQPVLVHNASDVCGLPGLSGNPPRLHGTLPSSIPTHVSLADLRLAESKLTTSIASRRGYRGVLDAGHRARIKAEQRLLSQVSRRMSTR